ncbi:MAG TPA: sel1 repeat family protein [Dyella sp.]|uniref:tetratricopeptide repeat protein n=1 Tax=Dyella sp. TaxID=1869338 RepID=UPI002D775301|nr:sel1 repeat family protein [Dyella sp.]HET6553060.1 sel1 repeat family protein [Dyella sp.]
MAVQKSVLLFALSLAASAAPFDLLAQSGNPVESQSPDAVGRPNGTSPVGQGADSQNAPVATAGFAPIPVDTTTPPPKVVSYRATRDVPVSRRDAFNTPTDDGRPGDYFFYLGALADQRHDYEHAIAMYQVAASWAHKAAEYNLGVLYLNGHGSPVDLPRAMAWFALAAERGDTQYVYAKQLLYAQLTPEQFERANVIWRELLPTYGDAVALRRAKARWREVRYSMTGSRVGSSAMHLTVGGMLGRNGHDSSPNYDVGTGGHLSVTPGEITGVHQSDGYLAYQELRESNNPYDPAFKPYLYSGTVTVGILTPVKADDPALHKQQPPLDDMPSSHP